MKAVCWYGPGDVRVMEVADPHIIRGRDAIVRVTASGICGTDLHIYDGLIPGMRPGEVLGHEVVGVVEEVGDEVTGLRPGDRVVAPFVVGCGRCRYCQEGLWSLCDNSNPYAGLAEEVYGQSPAGLLGHPRTLGGYAGGQAEFVRIPFADAGLHVLPDGVSDEQGVTLADALPTGYMAAERCDIREGDTVAVWGCGPVGQFAIRAAHMLGARRVIAIDTIPERLVVARDTGGAIVLDSTRVDVLDALRELTGGRGPDACIDAVGMEAQGTTLDALYDRAMQMLGSETGRPHALRQAIVACRKGGTVSVAGSYVGVVDKFPLGAAFAKGLSLKMGRTHVHRYIPTLLEAIQSDGFDPSYVVTHTLRLNDARRGYELMAEGSDGCLKVVLKTPSAYGPQQERAVTYAVEPSERTPSQAEGERETVEEDLARHGLESAPAEQLPQPRHGDEGWPEERPLPGQAEGERED